MDASIKEAGVADKRRTKRTALLYYLQVIERNADRFFGRLVNISSEGVMIVTDRPIDKDVILQLRLLLPEEACGKTDMNFDACCMWSKKDVNPRYYVSGFQMLDVTEREVETIVNLIVDYGLPD
jgi:hypothetical protein